MHVFRNELAVAFTSCDHFLAVPSGAPEGGNQCCFSRTKSVIFFVPVFSRSEFILRIFGRTRQSGHCTRAIVVPRLCVCFPQVVLRPEVRSWEPFLRSFDPLPCLLFFNSGVFQPSALSCPSFPLPPLLLQHLLTARFDRPTCVIPVPFPGPRGFLEPKL